MPTFTVALFLFKLLHLFVQIIKALLLYIKVELDFLYSLKLLVFYAEYSCSSVSVGGKDDN